MSDWRAMPEAPLDGSEILLLLGETIPDHLDVRAGTFADGDMAEGLGYREYAKYGAWMIWNGGDDWFLIDVAKPLGWVPLPAPGVIENEAWNAAIEHAATVAEGLNGWGSPPSPSLADQIASRIRTLAKPPAKVRETANV